MMYSKAQPHRASPRRLAVPQVLRRSLLIQLVSVYLLFVVVVLIAGVGVNAVVEQRLRHDVEVSDQALAQQIALDTSAKLLSAEASLETLGSRAARTPNAMIETFQAFMAARSDVEHVYWLDALARLWPFGGREQERIS
jgi:hypothetical protein